MADVTAPDAQTQTVLQFKARVENGVIIPEEAITVPTGQVYLVTLQLAPAEEAAQPLNALAEIVALAQPLGPADLARHFDTYTGRVLTDEPAR